MHNPLVAYFLLQDQNSIGFSTVVHTPTPKGDLFQIDYGAVRNLYWVNSILFVMQTSFLTSDPPTSSHLKTFFEGKWFDPLSSCLQWGKATDPMSIYRLFDID